MARETIPSLFNAFLGKPLETDIWENDAFIGGRIRTEGEPACSSANWCTTAGAVALYAQRPYARGWWLQYFDQAAYRFMGKEPFSRIYSHWIAFPVMYVGYHAARHNDLMLLDRAQSWLRAFWTYLCVCGVDHDQKNQFVDDRSFGSLATSFCGARSFERDKDKDGNVHRGAPYHLDAWITGTILKRALFNTPFPTGWFEDDFAQIRAMESNSYNWTGLTEDQRQTLIRILRGQIGQPEIDAIRTMAGPYKTLPTYRLVRSAAGVTLYMEKLIDTGTSGATAPIYGCFTNPDGQQQWLAPDNGFRPAGELVHSAVSFGLTRVENGRVFASRGDGQVFREDTESLKHSIPLPAGPPILDLRFGPGGLEVLTPSSTTAGGNTGGGNNGGGPNDNMGPNDPPQPPGIWIPRAEFERIVWERYFKHLPPQSDAAQILQHLFQTLYLIMDGTDPRTAAVKLTAENKKKIEETLANTQQRVRLV